MKPLTGQSQKTKSVRRYSLENNSSQVDSVCTHIYFVYKLRIHYYDIPVTFVAVVVITDFFLYFSSLALVCAFLYIET